MKDNFEKKYREFISQFEMVGSTCLIADKNNILGSATYNFESIEKNIPTSLDTIYRIASISKVIVAIGVLMLVDKGLIDLDEDISKYLGFKVRNPKYTEVPITTRMLMTQSSSISDDGENRAGYDSTNQFDDEVLLEDILSNPNSEYYTEKTFLNHKPGTYFRYSNFGCGILACIVERVTGERFTDYIKEKLLLPMGIKSGFRLEDIENIDRLASHYLYENGEFILYRDYERFKNVQCLKYSIGNNYRGVAGGLYISIVDLLKIMQMLMNKGIYSNQRYLKEETVLEMEKAHWNGKTEDPTYNKKGLQMIIMDEFTKDPLHGHFGNAYGLRSFMLYNKSYGYIFLCNGANFITDEEHMTILQKKLIEFLVDFSGDRK